jgi:hypothetical protein
MYNRSATGDIATTIAKHRVGSAIVATNGASKSDATTTSVVMIGVNTKAADMKETSEVVTGAKFGAEFWG